VISEKVRREQSVVRDNVLILQYKNIADVNDFLNRFDWRDDKRGKRYYIEIDYSMYDKSQTKQLGELYLKKLEMFGVLPDLLRFLAINLLSRSVSSVKAGVKMWLEGQNMSGAPYTLDRNNDVNMVATSHFLETVVDMIEFIIMMGDDMTVAVRGVPDLTSWEAEANRLFNLSVKAMVHQHGYICSMDIVHLPEGRSVVMPDVIKRAVMLGDTSVKDREKVHERYVSYADGMKGVGDPAVGAYLRSALPLRYEKSLGTVTAEAVDLLLRSHATFVSSESQYMRLYACEKTVRFV